MVSRFNAFNGFLVKPSMRLELISALEILMSERRIESWMWTHACLSVERAERHQRHFFHPMRRGADAAVWEPPVDIFETTETFVIIAALPGAEPDEVSVRFIGDELIIEGRRALPAWAVNSDIHRIEIPFGRFERRISLPAKRLTVELHEMADGCLTLRLRKS